MHLSLRLPAKTAWQPHISSQNHLPFSYEPLHTTQQNQAIPDFDNDFLRVKIGEGETDFHQACEAIRRWQMFPAAWTKIFPENAPIEAGTTVAMCARFLGIWWGLPCRILYVVNEPGRFGFAYGTLPGHVEQGEELFLVELENGEVFYQIKAISRPRHWLAKLGYPLMRLLQSKFRRDSAKDMKIKLNRP
ncbi:MAG: DUF1990 domain-containing protein [Bacteroidota bacterium]